MLPSGQSVLPDLFALMSAPPGSDAATAPAAAATAAVSKPAAIDVDYEF